MRSIMQKNTNYCFLCAALHDDFSKKPHMQKHHAIYGRGKRNLSEQYGLFVYLCNRHHTYDQGPEAVHRNKDTSTIVKKAAEYAFILAYPDLDFLGIFGKHYLADFERPKRRKLIKTECDGFAMLGDYANDNDFSNFGGLLDL